MVILISSFHVARLSLFRNQGNGTFQLQVSYNVGLGSALFSSDLDSDGDCDLAVADSGGTEILSNNGSGGFHITSPTYATGGDPRSLIARDIDGDRDNDLIEVSSLLSVASVLENSGDGTFQAGVNYLVGKNPNSLASADFDADGKIDLAVANSGSSNISVLLNTGNGLLGQAINYAIPAGAASIYASDLDGDGYSDLIVSGNGVSILINDGLGEFNLVENYGVGDVPGPSRSVVAADLDRDNDNDIVLVSTIGVVVMLNEGDGSFSQPVVIDTTLANSV